MTNRHYPELNEKDLKLIIRIYEDDPDYFDDENCPYDSEIKEFFKGEASVHYFDTHGSAASKPPSDDDILAQVTALYDRLNEYWNDVKDSENSSDKNTYFRVSVSLMERLTTLKEKMSNLKNVNTFMAEVLQIMDEILTPDQRNEIMKRLEKFQLEMGEQQDDKEVSS